MNINVVDDLFGVFFLQMEITNKNVLLCITILLRDMLNNLIVDKCRGCRYPLGCS